MRKMVIGTIAFMMSLFSFTLAYYSLTPAFKTLWNSANSTMASANVPAAVTTIWNRAKTFYSLAWPAWGALGVIFLIIWLLNYLQKEDPYSYYTGGPRA